MDIIFGRYYFINHQWKLTLSLVVYFRLSYQLLSMYQQLTLAKNIPSRGQRNILTKCLILTQIEKIQKISDTPISHSGHGTRVHRKKSIQPSNFGSSRFITQIRWLPLLTLLHLMSTPTADMCYVVQQHYISRILLCFCIDTLMSSNFTQKGENHRLLRDYTTWVKFRGDISTTQDQSVIQIH